MTNNLTEKIQAAVQEKKLNKTAHDEILKWLSEDEFVEFRSALNQKINKAAWEFFMDAFYRTVMFGTGGIRGVMDIGTNRINNYTIRRASQAYAQYLIKYKSDIVHQGVAIAYDSRLNSETFMKETARVLAANGIPVFIFTYYRATPELSFCVRYLGLAGGIVITASHNPPEFNGYKVYDEHGVQILPDAGLKVETEFQSVTAIKKMSFDEAVAKGLIRSIDETVDKAFADAAKKVSVYPGRDVKIVYSPLHGVGSQSVLPVLKEIGFTDITVVEEQMSLDGTFPEVAEHFPNPEFAVVYEKPIALARKIDADVVIVSDPDADRLGVAVPDRAGDWVNLSGNQTAVLLLYFCLQALHDAKRLPLHGVVMKTTVTSELVRAVAESFGLEVVGDLLVGFKFLGDRIERLPKEKQCLFACEESCGYLFGDAYRDKGAETPAVVAAEMAAWCKEKQITPLDLLETVYAKYGYYAERLYYRLIEGFGALDQMNLAMKKLREQLPVEIAQKKILKVMDRLTGEVRDGQTGGLFETRDWDKGDMLSFFFTDDERTVIHLRPSGTEPKMKYYTTVKGSLSEKTKAQIDTEAKQLEEAVAKIFEGILQTIQVNVF